ncbi:hypothetical protein [Streptomyces sp. NPDC001933]|uniref:hypothetical protein n=1 Tax=Streptomyces sp. NPDC001933 TaxID=3364626 RepID=UPI0036C46512
MVGVDADVVAEPGEGVGGLVVGEVGGGDFEEQFPDLVNVGGKVAYVLIPPTAGAKTLALEFARYLGIPASGHMSQAQIVSTLRRTYTVAGVQLVMIEEIHRLNHRTRRLSQAYGRCGFRLWRQGCSGYSRCRSKQPLPARR